MPSASQPRDYSFVLCGVAGLLLAVPFTLFLTASAALSIGVEVLLIVCALSTLLLVPLTIKVFTGKETLVLYRDVICTFVTLTLALRFMHRPLLPYLDVTIAGAGLLLTCGRVGCFLAGCCYGRPCRLGIRYDLVHAAMGFPSPLVGVCLFPIQLLESFWSLCLSGFAGLLTLHSSHHGLAVATYITGYALGRFSFEFARGDADRPYMAGFSHAQWVSLLLTSGVALASLNGILPRVDLLLVAPLFILITMFLVRLLRLHSCCFELLHPDHILEIACMLRRLKGPFSLPRALTFAQRTSPIEVMTTSLGLRISLDHVHDRGREIHIYTLSREHNLLSSRCVHLLGRLISRLQRHSATCEVRYGEHGVWHILSCTEGRLSA